MFELIAGLAMFQLCILPVVNDWCDGKQMDVLACKMNKKCAP